MGRVAVVVDAEPEIFATRYAVGDGTLVFPVRSGTELLSALKGSTLALEADGVDTDTEEAWSVMVLGTASLIDDPAEGREWPQPDSWSVGPRQQLVRLESTRVTGRQFTIVDPAIWRDPYSLRRRSPFD